jgi:MoxR-like ATPase
MIGDRAIRAMLPVLDAAIEREVMRLRGRYQLSLDEFRGLYISDERIDDLLRNSGIEPVPSDDVPIPAQVPVRWARLVEVFGLSATEERLLLIALAPEIDPKYATLYAYLNDDAARVWPTFDLARRLLGGAWETLGNSGGALHPKCPLARQGLIRLVDESLARPLHAFRLAPVVLDFLLGLDPLATAGLSLVEPRAGSADDASDVVRLLGAADGRPLVLIEGRHGSGRAALAAGIAHRLGRPLARLTPTRGDALGVALRDAMLAAPLADTALICVLDGVAPDPGAMILAEARIAVFLAAEPGTAWQATLADLPVVTLRCRTPAIERRRELWREALRAERVRAPPAAVDAVARRYRLNPGQIRRAARDLRLAARQPPSERSSVTAQTVFDSARAQCTLELGGLATRLDGRAGWDDLVLPQGVRRQLKDFAEAATDRERVFESWGFAGVGRGAGRGVAALFAGVSGTGKTMSASVIAGAAGLDLWRIDLSACVSKYIGETEKNLDRIFTGARAADAVLFFDEADALFGKRSDVKDAHDRYANIEVAYLLQRLEEHDGVVILASNLSRNIDPAFSRRLHYVIEFPMPDTPLRERLWRKAFPPEAPVAGDADFAFLARRFAFSGGDIRAAALDAAFLAAHNGGEVAMPHLVRAVARQMLKQGKIPSANDFRPYHAPLAELPVAEPAA